MIKEPESPQKPRRVSTRKLQLDGQRFGMWQVIGDIGARTATGAMMWDCVCDCGTRKTVAGNNLVGGYSTNCGCLAAEQSRQRKQKYPIGSSSLRSAWHGMIRRCYDMKCDSYKGYGGRGVRVCDEWRNSFIPFYYWAIDNGWQKGLQVDKDIKGDGLLYSPETCSVVTPKQNSQKRRTNFYITHNEETRALMEWCEILNLVYSRTAYRIQKFGYSLQDCIDNPEDKRGKSYSKKTVLLEHNGITKTQAAWAVVLKTSPTVIYQHLKKGEKFSEIHEHFSNRNYEVNLNN